jgi:hypothetical protein
MSQAGSLSNGSGGGTNVEKINVQTGTSPVVTANNTITFNGAVVAAGTNPVRTDGTAPATMALEVQTAQAIASTDATKIGLAAFNSADFTVDANGFVSTVAPSNPISKVVQQIFTSSGTYTPSSGMKYCIVQCVGGGGGGGGAGATTSTTISCAGGGGSGGYANGIFTAATIGASQALVVGSGGIGGSGANGGGFGTQSSFGGSFLLFCGGASGGGSSTAGNIIASGGGGGAGAGGTNQNYSIGGQSGSYGFGNFAVGSSFALGGAGGSNPLGSGGCSVVAVDGAGSPGVTGSGASGHGSGGGGAVQIDSQSATFVGGAGAGGIIIITEYI